MEIIAIGGSAGSFKIATDLLSNIKKGSHKTVIVCLHRWKEKSTDFVKTLTVKSSLQAIEITDKMEIQAEKIYVAPPNYHVYVTSNMNFVLTNEEEFSFSRPSIDICFSSIASVFCDKATGILLSGANNDGAIGLLDIYRAGGNALVQLPSECEISVMPEAAIEINPYVTILSVCDIKKQIIK